MGGFYEWLVGCSNMASRKVIKKKYLIPFQLQIFLSKNEAALNSRPLVYIGDDLNDGVKFTPSHFLILKSKTGTQIVKEDKGKDPHYELNNPSSKKALLNT